MMSCLLGVVMGVEWKTDVVMQGKGNHHKYDIMQWVPGIFVERDNHRGQLVEQSVSTFYQHTAFRQPAFRRYDYTPILFNYGHSRMAWVIIVTYAYNDN